MGVCKQRATCYSMWVLISLPEERRDTSCITIERITLSVWRGRRVTSDRKGRRRDRKKITHYLSIYLSRTREKEKASNLLIINVHNSECFPLSPACKSYSYLSSCIYLAFQLILILLYFCSFSDSDKGKDLRREDCVA